MKIPLSYSFKDFLFYGGQDRDVHISLIMHIIYLTPLVHTENIAMEGTLSQILYTCPHLFFFIKCRKNIQKNNQKVAVFFHKIKTRMKSKNLRHSSINMDVGYIYTKF